MESSRKPEPVTRTARLNRRLARAVTFALVRLCRFTMWMRDWDWPNWRFPRASRAFLAALAWIITLVNESAWFNRWR